MKVLSGSPPTSTDATVARGASFIGPADRWGPFATDLDAGERLARLRSLRAIVGLCCGPRGAALAAELRLAEQDLDHLPAALAAIASLAALDRRQVLATFARLHRPA